MTKANDGNIESLKSKLLRRRITLASFNAHSLHMAIASFIFPCTYHEVQTLKGEIEEEIKSLENEIKKLENDQSGD